MICFRGVLIYGLPFSAAFRVFGSTKPDDTQHGAEVRLSHGETYSLEDSVVSMLDSFSPCILGQGGDGSDDGEGLQGIFSKLCELAPPPSCFRNMLAAILPSCEILTTDERVAFSIRLTLCELSAAHIKPPRSCSFEFDDHLNRQSCLKSLEASPQFWTSFSGNFRSIATICLAERKNHEKEEVIRLHQNITAIQAHALHVLRDQLAEIDLEGRTLNEIAMSWTRVLSDLESNILALGKNLERLSAKSTEQLENQNKAIMTVLESSIARAMALDDISGSMIERLKRDSNGLFELSASLKDSMETSYGAAEAYTLAMKAHMASFVESTLANYTMIKDVLADVSLSLSNASKDSSLIADQQQYVEQFILDGRMQLDHMLQGQGLMLDRLHESNRAASEMADLVLNLKISAVQGIASVTTQSEASTQRMRDTFGDVESTLQRFMSSVEAAESSFLRFRTSIGTRLFLSLICVLIFFSNNIFVKYGIVFLVFVYGVRPTQLDLVNFQNLMLLPRHLIRTLPHVFIPGVAIAIGIFVLFSYVCWWLYSRSQGTSPKIGRGRYSRNSHSEIRRNSPEEVLYY
ncbi:Tht1-like nuclear fusion protein-domain-containing protein [Lipomyces tetrasporus]|uniref:Nuclear fusion protein KAR5 n=1 Tax=Lipomyces tetrasporus TaxID=54092 RepID=A0AAD7QZ58_9ASCO|nr:Tht1-like nuclear fusion protein-domain-containing protein [Lipomyces tetrasporus]KAJ8104098.1 Tht1-like nuclear fusion protein-domain-containing protein [Lipomyces tetrasporus]